MHIDLSIPISTANAIYFDHSIHSSTSIRKHSTITGRIRRASEYFVSFMSASLGCCCCCCLFVCILLFQCVFVHTCAFDDDDYRFEKCFNEIHSLNFNLWFIRIRLVMLLNCNRHTLIVLLKYQFTFVTWKHAHVYCYISVSYVHPFVVRAPSTCAGGGNEALFPPIQTIKMKIKNSDEIETKKKKQFHKCAWRQCPQ